MGIFLVFEGGDGSGKSTQARILHRRLTREGHGVLLTHEPGGTPLGEAVRRWLKTHSLSMPLTELLLFTAARAQHVDQIIAPALDSGQIVICDRFEASTVAYQGYGRGIELDLIHRLKQEVTGGLRPDLTIFLDVPVEEGLARKGSGSRDAFESEAVEFHQRVRQGYHAMASAGAGDWLVLDGGQRRDALADQILIRVRPLLD